jgi:hypothetical protein
VVERYSRFAVTSAKSNHPMCSHQPFEARKGAGTSG